MSLNFPLILSDPFLSDLPITRVYPRSNADDILRTVCCSVLHCVAMFFRVDDVLHMVHLLPETSLCCGNNKPKLLCTVFC